ncbi:MAG: hypothetical protein WAN17_18420, partial [Candidatus Sulfotelmatobacter sp.]
AILLTQQTILRPHGTCGVDVERAPPPAAFDVVLLLPLLTPSRMDRAKESGVQSTVCLHHKK